MEVTKSQLPFQIIAGGTRNYLRYFGTIRVNGQVRKHHYDLEIGTSDVDSNPLALKIVQLCEAYWKMESEVGGLMVELEKLKAENAVLKGSLKSCEASNESLRRMNGKNK